MTKIQFEQGMIDRLIVTSKQICPHIKPKEFICSDGIKRLAYPIGDQQYEVRYIMGVLYRCELFQ